MVAPVGRIEQEIAELDKAVLGLADELYLAYSDYLNALGGAVYQQLILASFQVCTQGYPNRFLALSLGQRQELQQSIRGLAKQAKASLQTLLNRPDEPNSQFQSGLEDGAATEGADESVTAIAADEQQILPEMEHPSAQDIEQDAEPRSLTPSILMEWLETLENKIERELHRSSQKANRHLQQSEILPKKLSEPFFQGVSNSEMADLVASPPNLLNVLLEAQVESTQEDEDDLESPESSVIQIVAIHLRLSEIEFSDAKTASLRTRIRSLSARLKALGQQYRKKLQEYAIAQAQDAWRASWFED